MEPLAVLYAIQLTRGHALSAMPDAPSAILELWLERIGR
jgi:hypothetical protein